MEYLRKIPDLVVDAMMWQLERSPDWYKEQLIIMKVQSAMMERAPGKYDALTYMLHGAANFNPLSRILSPYVPAAGAGLYPDAQVPYYFGRLVDDVVDDDVTLPEGYPPIPDWLERLKKHLQNGGKDIKTWPLSIEFLLKRTILRMDGYPNLDIRHELTRFLDSMQIEHDRRIHTASMPRDTLWNLYKEEFGSPHNIMLAAFRSKIREEDIPELAQIQGRRYALKDLKADLAIGIIGIPSEVLREADISDTQACQPGGDILLNPVVAAWKDTELAECTMLAEQLKRRPLDRAATLYVKALS